MNILIGAILIVNVALVGLVLFCMIRVRAVYRDMIGFVTSPGNNEPSPLARTVEAAGDMLARSLVAQAKGAFMGKQSGEARAETAIAGDIAEDLINARSPMIGALLNSFPTLKKTIRRNPQLLDLALSKLAGAQGSGSQGSGAQGSSPGNNGHSSPLQMDFKL